MIERYREIRRQKAAGEREDGFTLIELLIVIVVLGILAAVVVFALGGVTGSSAKSACAADAKTVETAISAFQAQSTLSTASTGLVMPTPGAAGAGITTQAQATTAGLIPTYLRSFPVNSTHYYIGIGMSNATVPATSNEVDIAPGNGTGTPPAAGATWVNFDTEGSAAGCNAVS
jgi:prepilin-type N-terminal cleavage/methylation domain-containing protein